MPPATNSPDLVPEAGTFVWRYAPHRGLAGSRGVAVGVHLAVISLYMVLAAMITWPLILHFGGDVIGEHYFDRTQNLWNVWWVKTALLDLHTNPFHTDLLLYPQGIDLYFHTLNLPSGLFTVLPFLLFGLTFAYNAGIFFALVLSGYAGFRLVYYLTHSRVAAFVGGTIIGFNALSSVMIRAQINIASLQWFVFCIEFFLRGWNEGGRRNALLAGLFFTLSVLTVGYFEIHLLIFGAAFAVWAVLSTPAESWRSRGRALWKRVLPLIVWGGGIALLLVGPYVWGAWLSLQKGQVAIGSTGDDLRVVLNSSDLLSFFVPNRNHWLVGENAPWWNLVNPAILDYTYLGIASLSLASIGVWSRRRCSMTWLWVALGATGLVLALGPVLQVNNGRTFGGFEIPLPFSLLQHVPLVGLVRSPIRFVTLTYVSLGVLSGWGLCALWSGRSWMKRTLLVGGVIGLILLEMPLRMRNLEPVDVSSSLASLGKENEPGAVLELPLTQHGRVDVHRMLYQTSHGHPITSAYLSRDVIDPYMQVCSPLRTFQSASETLPIVDANDADIISPTVASQPLSSLLRESGFAFVAVYKQGFYDANQLTPVPAGLLSSLQALAGQLGTTVAEDNIATTYQIRGDSDKVGLYMQLGESWHGVEESYGQPFRWMNGAEADMCIFSPEAHSGYLTMQASSFSGPRHLQIWVGAEKIADEQVPSDGALHKITTGSRIMEWPKGPQRIRFIVPEGSVRPIDVGQRSDKRELSIGLGTIRLEGEKPTTKYP